MRIFYFLFFIFMRIYYEIKGKIESLTLIRHLAQEISRFFKYFLEYNGEVNSRVHSSKFSRSPPPQSGPEMPNKLWVGKGKTSLEIFKKMKGFLLELSLVRKNLVECKDRRER